MQNPSSVILRYELIKWIDLAFNESTNLSDVLDFTTSQRAVMDEMFAARPHKLKLIISIILKG